MTKTLVAIALTLLLCIPLANSGIIFIEPAAGGGGGTDLTADASCEGAWIVAQAAGTAIEDECDSGGDTEFTHTDTTPTYKTVSGFNWVLTDGDGWLEMSDATSADLDSMTDAITIGGFIELTATDFTQSTYTFAPTDELIGEWRGSDTPQFIRITSELNSSGLDGPDQDAGDIVHWVVTHNGATNTLELFIDGVSDDTTGSQFSDYTGDTGEACYGTQLSSGTCQTNFNELGYTSNLGAFSSVLSDCEICDWCRFGLDGAGTDRGDTACNTCTPCPPP